MLRFAGDLEFELNATNNRNWFAGRRSRGESGKFHFFTWDGEISMGNDRFQSPGVVEVNRETGFDLTLVGEADSPAVAYAALRGNGEFRVRFADRLHRHFSAGGALDPGVAAARWEVLGGFIRGALVAESARWGNVHGGQPLRRDVEWEEEFEWVRDEFLREQTARVLGYFRDRGLLPETEAPEFAVAGGYVEAGQRLEIVNPNAGGKVYFTTDGSDPRRGLEMATEVVLEEFSEVSYLVPSAGNGGAFLGGGWRGTGEPANSDGWNRGRAGVGFERVAADYAELIRANTGEEMEGLGGSVFVRVPFRVEDLQAFRDGARAVLQMKYDDGFVAYVNGVEVARANAPEVVSWDSFATGANPDPRAVVFEGFDLSASVEVFREGENMLAIHGMNVAPESSDFLVSPRIVIFGKAQPAGLAVNAEEFAGDYLLGRTTTVNARVLSAGGEWSPRSEVTYTVDVERASPASVVVSEFHYRPGRPVAGEEAVATGRGDFEFVEVSNVSRRGVDLAGARFTDGVEFIFPQAEESLLAPGGRVVVVSNEVAFRLRYGGRAVVAGEFAGGSRLSNGGETVTLVASDGRVISSFRYDDEAPWPGGADGGGLSVVLRELTGGRGAAASDWRASYVGGGTPGAVEADTDRDGLADGWEERFFGGLVEGGDGDADADGLSNAGEMRFGTDPLVADSDGDGAVDEDEVGVSDPLVADSDGDGVADGDEVGTSDPRVPDQDRDGLNDGGERLAGTDPLVADSDGDGVPDG
ncbi:MAG: lamin tail domain-containing protein, partial [Verrucomicrobiales bacterium]|nr:lamin tail domain-containing protein [Verrucomicrobiales bacterium]